MAGHSGGSWKVAYADFVTAMMAFFLVMWIGAQDQKTRQSVANYFVDPSGASKKPVAPGSAFDAAPLGPVPKDSGTDMGHGTKAIAQGSEPSPTTKAVIDWYQADTKRHAYWKETAQRCREEANQRVAKSGEKKDPETLAAQRLETLLREELRKDIDSRAGDPVFKELARTSLREVNWDQAARELLHSH